MRVKQVGLVAGMVFFALSSTAMASYYQNATVAYASVDRIYLVAWLNQDGDVMARRISSVGVQLDAQPMILHVSGGFANQFGKPRVASDGTSFMVVWGRETTPNDWDVFGTVVDAQTGAIGSAFPIIAGPNTEIYPDVAFDASTGRYLVVWSDTTRVAAARVQGTTVLDVGGLTLAPMAVWTPPSVATGAGEWLVVWGASNPLIPGSAEIVGAFVTPGGVVLTPGGQQITANPGLGDHRPSLAYGDGRFLLAWEAMELRSFFDVDIRFTCLVSDGAGGATVQSPTGEPIAVGATFDVGPSVSFNGVMHAVSWARFDYDTLQFGIHEMSVAKCDELPFIQLQLSDPFTFQKYRVASASDGYGRTLTVWEDHRAAGSRVYLRGAITAHSLGSTASATVVLPDFVVTPN